MSSVEAAELPDLQQVFAQLLGRVPSEQQPLLIALAERMAAQRYRSWANASADEKSELLACAAREEEIASRIEALYPGAAEIQTDILSENSDLEEINRSLFAERPLLDQFAMQARGERLGAATWRALAKREDVPSRRDTLLACAELEEESALVLEGILRSREARR
ncbi:MAG: hypothetical protein ABFS46_17050 [Myxococcota bacterium]